MPRCSFAIAPVKLLSAASISDCVLRDSTNCISMFDFLCLLPSVTSSAMLCSQSSISAMFTSDNEVGNLSKWPCSVSSVDCYNANDQVSTT
eukprot:8863-Heterococcus_DN1.PRE.1